MKARGLWLYQRTLEADNHNWWEDRLEDDSFLNMAYHGSLTRVEHLSVDEARRLCAHGAN